MQAELDAEIVGWVGRVGAAGAEHVMGRFQMRRSWCYARLERLSTDRLLEPRAVLHRRPALYVATTAGLRWRGLGCWGFAGCARVASSTRGRSRGLPLRCTGCCQAGGW